MVFVTVVGSRSLTVAARLRAFAVGGALMLWVDSGLTFEHLGDRFLQHVGALQQPGLFL
jgi:hypothetical protein